MKLANKVISDYQPLGKHLLVHKDLSNIVDVVDVKGGGIVLKIFNEQLQEIYHQDFSSIINEKRKGTISISVDSSRVLNYYYASLNKKTGLGKIHKVEFSLANMNLTKTTLFSFNAQHYQNVLSIQEIKSENNKLKAYLYTAYDDDVVTRKEIRKFNIKPKSYFITYDSRDSLLFESRESIIVHNNCNFESKYILSNTGEIHVIQRRALCPYRFLKQDYRSKFYEDFTYQIISDDHLENIEFTYPNVIDFDIFLHKDKLNLVLINHLKGHNDRINELLLTSKDKLSTDFEVRKKIAVISDWKTNKIVKNDWVGEKKLSAFIGRVYCSDLSISYLDKKIKFNYTLATTGASILNGPSGGSQNPLIMADYYENEINVKSLETINQKVEQFHINIGNDFSSYLCQSKEIGEQKYVVSNQLNHNEYESIMYGTEHNNSYKKIGSRKFSDLVGALTLCNINNQKNVLVLHDYNFFNGHSVKPKDLFWLDNETIFAIMKVGSKSKLVKFELEFE
jgi:hypothetical protein